MLKMMIQDEIKSGKDDIPVSGFEDKERKNISESTVITVDFLIWRIIVKIAVLFG